MPPKSPTKKTGVVAVKRIIGVCEIFSTLGPMKCFLCGVVVPANTPHRCEKTDG